MDHQSTPDDVDTRSSSQTGPQRLPRQSTPGDAESQAGHQRLPRQITPDDVDIRWPFRAGYPRLLRPPVESIPIEADKPISDANLDRLQSRIIEILKSYKLPWCTRLTPLPEVVYRRQQFGTSGLPRVLVRCDYEKETSHSKNWTKAVVEIYAEIQSVVEGNREVGVEMADMVFMNPQICALPTRMTQELSANWENGDNYCEKILRLFEAPHEMFQAMIPVGRCHIIPTGVFNDGEPTYQGSAAVFFDALNAEDVLWDSIEERIRSILPSHIGIEIRQRFGPLLHFPQRDLDGNEEWVNPSPEEYQRLPRPGCNIGVEGGRSAGTMGGYVVTEDENGKRTTYGVTNAHVALQSNEKQIFSASADSGIKMVSPSEIFRAKAKPKIFKDIPRLENKIKFSKEIIDAWKEKDPDLCRAEKRFLEYNESELASAKSTLNLIEQDPYVGSVYHAKLGNTDYSIASSQCEVMMDLALIKMDCPGAERPQKVYLKEKFNPPIIPPHAVCGLWETDSLGISHDGDNKNHIKVVGKSIGPGAYRFGIVNDCRAVLFPFTENGAENDKKFYACAVTSPPSYRRGVFSTPGDSGSFVFALDDWEYCGFDNQVTTPSPQAPVMSRYNAMQPFVVGLLFGTSQIFELSYFIPFDAVKSEIESLTGEVMVWPRKRTDCVGEDVA